MRECSPVELFVRGDEMSVSDVTDETCAVPDCGSAAAQSITLRINTPNQKASTASALLIIPLCAQHSPELESDAQAFAVKYWPNGLL